MFWLKILQLIVKITQQYTSLGGNLKSGQVFFSKSYDSRLLVMYEASNKSYLKSWPFDDIKEKVIHIPLNDIIPFFT